MILCCKVFGDFDWDRFYVTLFGFAPLRSRNPMQYLGDSPHKASPGQTLKLGVQQVDYSNLQLTTSVYGINTWNFLPQVECFPDRAIRSINIQDPLSASNNLGLCVFAFTTQNCALVNNLTIAPFQAAAFVRPAPSAFEQL